MIPIRKYPGCQFATQHKQLECRVYSKYTLVVSSNFAYTQFSQCFFKNKIYLIFESFIILCCRITQTQDVIYILWEWIGCFIVRGHTVCLCVVYL